MTAEEGRFVTPEELCRLLNPGATGHSERTPPEPGAQPPADPASEWHAPASRTSVSLEVEESARLGTDSGATTSGTAGDAMTRPGRRGGHRAASVDLDNPAAEAIDPAEKTADGGGGRDRRAGRRAVSAEVNSPAREENDPAETAPDGGQGRGRGRRRRKDGAVPPGTPAASGVSSTPRERARDICLRMLTARPRSRAELRRSLLNKEISEEVADQVLGRLSEVGLIDDAAFAEVFVRSRQTYQGLGRRALRVELRRKGVDDDVVADAVAAVDDEAEESRARELVVKRLRNTSEVDETKLIRRLVGMLARKGYPEGLAYRVVRDELRNRGHDAETLDDVG